jgi:hippurate hydrolase
MIMLDRLREHRRRLHRIPELDFDLPQTHAYVREVLSALPCEIAPAGRGSGLCAYFDAGKPDTIAFRSDMDALPITEENECPYASTHPGKMHACGHDGHMAVLLGFAEEIAKRANDLPHNVLLVFQAAEETTDGAQEIVDAGVFERYKVSKVFGLHLWPGYEKGAVVCRRGAFMAKACVVKVEIFGKSSHAAAAGKGVDALLCGVKFITEAYRAERSAFADDVLRLLKFCTFESGTAMNIVAGHAAISGTIRCFDEGVFSELTGRLRAVAVEAERESGCRIDIDFVEGCPAVCNDSALFDRFKEVICAPARPIPGDDGAAFSFVEPDEPAMTSEDFSVYQRAVPGVFFHLGLGRNAPLHSTKFDFDESALLFGVKAFLRLLYNI